MDDISIMPSFFAPALGHLSVTFVSQVRCFGLHLPLQLRVLLGLILYGHITVLISILSMHVV